jgi:anti-sigma28 factor (negative regulator of flagellin synthesis)
MAENRTNEFMSMARSLPKDGSLPPQILSSPPPSSSNNNRNNNTKNDRNASSISQLKDFHNTAGGISRDIASTSSMLAELTQLVRQKSLFQDDSQQVNELVIRIKAAIENLNGRLDGAGRTIAQQKRTMGKNSQPAQAASNVVGQLQEEFGQAAAGFKTILQQRTDVMKETTDRKKDIYGTSTGAHDVEDIPILNLENRPPVYGMSQDYDNYDDNNGGGFGGSGNGMGSGGFPTLDLTSGMMAAGESTGSQLPRPRKLACSMYWFYSSIQRFSLLFMEGWGIEFFGSVIIPKSNEHID